MKRMIVALVLLGVIMCSAFVSTYLANNAIDKTCAAFKICTEERENEELHLLKIREAVSVWNHNQKIFYVIMFNEDFSEIEKNIAELECLSIHYDFIRGALLCAETEILLDNKKEEIQLSFENIF